LSRAADEGLEAPGPLLRRRDPEGQAAEGAHPAPVPPGGSASTPLEAGGYWVDERGILHGESVPRDEGLLGLVEQPGWGALLVE